MDWEAQKQPAAKQPEWRRSREAEAANAGPDMLFELMELGSQAQCPFEADGAFLCVKQHHVERAGFRSNQGAFNFGGGQRRRRGVIAPARRVWRLGRMLRAGGRRALFPEFTRGNPTGEAEGAVEI